MNTAVLLPKEDIIKRVSLVHDLKITEKQIHVSDKRYNKETLKQYLVFYNTNDVHYKKISKIFDDIISENGFTLSNGENLSFNQEENTFLIDYETIVTTGEVEEILYSELGLKMKEWSI